MCKENSVQEVPNLPSINKKFYCKWDQLLELLLELNLTVLYKSGVLHIKPLDDYSATMLVLNDLDTFLYTSGSSEDIDQFKLDYNALSSSESREINISENRFISFHPEKE